MNFQHSLERTFILHSFVSINKNHKPQYNIYGQRARQPRMNEMSMRDKNRTIHVFSLLNVFNFNKLTISSRVFEWLESRNRM